MHRILIYALTGAAIGLAQSAQVTVHERNAQVNATEGSLTDVQAVEAVECVFLRNFGPGCAEPNEKKRRSARVVTSFLPSAPLRRPGGAFSDIVGSRKYVFVPIDAAKKEVPRRISGDLPESPPESGLLAGYCQFDAEQATRSFRCVIYEADQTLSEQIQSKGLLRHAASVLKGAVLTKASWRLGANGTRLFYFISGLAERDGKLEGVHLAMDAHSGEVMLQ